MFAVCTVLAPDFWPPMTDRLMDDDDFFVGGGYLSEMGGGATVFFIIKEINSSRKDNKSETMLINSWEILYKKFFAQDFLH